MYPSSSAISGALVSKLNYRQTLRMGLDFSVVSLDPRIGGDTVSSDMLKLLFEGLTRFNQNGQIEYGIAESMKSPQTPSNTHSNSDPHYGTMALLYPLTILNMRGKKSSLPTLKQLLLTSSIPSKMRKKQKKGRFLAMKSESSLWMTAPYA